MVDVYYGAKMDWVTPQLIEQIKNQIRDAESVTLTDQYVKIRYQDGEQYYSHNEFAPSVAFIQATYWRYRAEKLMERERELMLRLARWESHVCHEIVVFDTDYKKDGIEEAEREIKSWLDEHGFFCVSSEDHEYGYDMYYSNGWLEAHRIHHWDFNGRVRQALILRLEGDGDE